MLYKLLLSYGSVCFTELRQEFTQFCMSGAGTTHYSITKSKLPGGVGRRTYKLYGKELVCFKQGKAERNLITPSGSAGFVRISGTVDN